MPNRQALFLNFDIKAQPDMVTCGPTCLHALYQHYGDDISLKQVIKEAKQITTGGTLAVMLGDHALRRGYKAHIYTYNLNVFDPTWFKYSSKKIVELLKKQMRVKKTKRKLLVECEAYIEFLQAGGSVKYAELNKDLIKNYLMKSIPILTGLSATYLYGTPREIGDANKYHSIKGEPVGHFVVINGFDGKNDIVYLADPMNPNPLKSQYYNVKFDRLINSILLGIVTYDANLLVIEPK
ncbi:MAG TPA: peptidase-C39 like family protein [Cyclobacteriaceae bacterium]